MRKKRLIDQSLTYGAPNLSEIMWENYPIFKLFQMVSLLSPPSPSSFHHRYQHLTIIIITIIITITIIIIILIVVVYNWGNSKENLWEKTEVWCARRLEEIVFHFAFFSLVDNVVGSLRVHRTETQLLFPPWSERTQKWCWSSFPTCPNQNANISSRPLLRFTLQNYAKRTYRSENGWFKISAGWGGVLCRAQWQSCTEISDIRVL